MRADQIELIQGQAGISGELIVCSSGPNGWTDWNCGPSQNGTDGQPTTLLVNDQIYAVVDGGTGGLGACIGCQGDGCFNGDGGSDGDLNFLNPLATYVSSEFLEGTISAGMILSTQ